MPETTDVPITWVPLATLRPHSRNDGIHPPEELAHLKQSLQEHGLYRNVVIADDGTLLAGHGVAEAARQLGQTAILAKRMPYGPDDPRALQILIGDNHIARLRMQDDAALVAVLQGLADHDPLALLGTGFDADALAALIGEQGFDAGNGPGDAGRDAEPQIDRAEQLREQWGVEVGQLWSLGEHRIIVGDCTDKAVAARLLAAMPIAALVTDPPYGMAWDGKVSSGIHGHGQPGSKSSNYGVTIANDDTPFDPAPFLHYEKIILWGFHHFSDKLPPGSVLVWIKRLDAAFGSFLSDADLAWMKGGEGVYCFRDQSLMAETQARLHPTQKPLPLLSWCIEKVSGPRDCIYDPFLGSGTTLIACENLQRICYGCEIDPGYVAVTLQRWADVTGKQPQRLM